MKRTSKSIMRISILTGLCAIFISVFYGKVITNPNSMLFSSNGDGLKNYYTYAYFIRNNISCTNFEGMNYPYGENFMYTDCHPILAMAIKQLSKFIPGLSDYSIGILNLLMVLSIAITVYVLYSIFKELKINYILAILGSIGITVLSPQIFRITGHFALSYSFFIPWTIYLLLLYESSIHRNKYIIFLVLSILIFFFIHAYLGMIAATIAFTYAIVGIINQYIQGKRINILKYFKILAASLIPIVIFYLFVKITDIHSGRTTNPWGILESHAELSTIFLPSLGPLCIIKEYLFPGLIQTWEGWSYIGISTILALLFYILISVINSVKARSVLIDKTWLDNIPLRQLLVSSILILAISLFIPFRFHLEWLLKYFIIIKQFRGLGRFAWVFYFVSTICLIYIVNKIFERLKEKKLNLAGYVLIILVPISLICEGIPYHNFTSLELIKSPNLFDINQTSESFRSDIQSINPSKYQAILSFPFFYIGSENFGKSANDKIYKLSFLLSYHLKLPMLESYLTRTSIHESKYIMQLLASNFYHKSLKDDLPSDKPFLLISLNENLSPAENNFLKKSKVLISNAEYSIYEIQPKAFFENTSFQEINDFNKFKDNLFQKNTFLVSDTTLYFSFLDFKQKSPGISFSENNGCYSGLQRNYNSIFSIEPGTLQVNRNYTTRFWMYNDGENFGQDCLEGMIFFQKRKGDHIEWLNPIITAGTSHEIFGKWSMVELSFDNNTNDMWYDLVIKGNDLSDKSIYIDDLLIFDSELAIYKYLKSDNHYFLFHNNHRIGIPSENAK
jgi:hypothetical protein